MPFCKVDDGELYYEREGDGSPLLLVSGISGTLGFWATQRSALSKHFDVVLHDQRGTGKSTKSPVCYSVTGMADDVLRLMDSLEIERADYIGHSTGGVIGEVLASRYPDRIGALILTSSWIRADYQMRLAFEVRSELLRTGGPLSYARSAPLFLYPPWFNSKNEALLRKEAEAAALSAPPVDITLSRIQAIMDFDGNGMVENILCPTLVMCARDDALTPVHYSQALADVIPGAELKVFETGGHSLARTMPVAFQATVLDFLRRQREM